MADQGLKASELIKQLQDLIEKHGDLPVYSTGDMEQEAPVSLDNVYFEESDYDSSGWKPIHYVVKPDRIVITGEVSLLVWKDRE